MALCKYEGSDTEVQESRKNSSRHSHEHTSYLQLTSLTLTYSLLRENQVTVRWYKTHY